MRFAVYLAVGLAGGVTLALSQAAAAAGGGNPYRGGLSTNASPNPGRPVPGRPIPTRPSPNDSVPTLDRPAIKPLDSSANRDIAPKNPQFKRSLGGTSRTPSECMAIAQREEKDEERMWERYRACTDMTDD
jgi:hypothetical protein